MNQPINILCATDKNFVSYCGIMLTSLFENEKSCNVHVYIMHDDSLANKDKAKFFQHSKKYHQDVTLVYVNQSIFEKYPSTFAKRWAISMYYRLLAADYLPNVDKIIYLDCDIIITQSLIQLWNSSMNTYAIAACEDPGTNNSEFFERLDYPPSYGYFNSGVLLMNLKYWRENNIVRKCMDYLVHNYDKLVCNDQDILNVILHKERFRLECTWNFMIYDLRDVIYEGLPIEMKNDISKTQKPSIIHYCDIDKPWQITYYHKPFYKEWNHYKKISLWKNTLPLLPKRHFVQKIIKRFILWPLGLCLGRDNQYVSLNS